MFTYLIYMNEIYIMRFDEGMAIFNFGGMIILMGISSYLFSMEMKQVVNEGIF